MPLRLLIIGACDRRPARAVLPSIAMFTARELHGFLRRLQ